MGNRLSKIYTRTGDAGTTGIGGGQRVEKDAPRIEAIGDVDELNSLLGLLISLGVPQDLHTELTQIQHRLFDLGGDLSLPGQELINADHIVELEQLLDGLNSGLPPLKDFILPGGNRTAAACHVARAVCRRAERRLTTLERAEPGKPHCAAYLNRLSDLLFVITRHLNRLDGSDEVLWQSKFSRTSLTPGNDS